VSRPRAGRVARGGAVLSTTVPVAPPPPADDAAATAIAAAVAVIAGAPVAEAHPSAHRAAVVVRAIQRQRPRQRES
jgi:hypothetical protein